MYPTYMGYERGFIQMFGTYSTAPNREEWKSFLFERRTTRTRGASRRVSRAWGGRFGSFGFYRFGSVSIGSVLGCLGDAFVVYCVLGVPKHPYVGGHGWMEWNAMDGMGWNGTRMERDALEPGARARSG